jgi:hypothetical protein
LITLVLTLVPWDKIGTSTNPPIPVQVSATTNDDRGPVDVKESHVITRLRTTCTRLPTTAGTLRTKVWN